MLGWKSTITLFIVFAVALGLFQAEVIILITWKRNYSGFFATVLLVHSSSSRFSHQAVRIPPPPSCWTFYLDVCIFHRNCCPHLCLCSWCICWFCPNHAPWICGLYLIIHHCQQFRRSVPIALPSLWSNCIRHICALYADQIRAWSHSGVALVEGNYNLFVVFAVALDKGWHW